MYDQDTLNKIVKILEDEKHTMEQMVALEEKKCNVLTEELWPDFYEIDEEQNEMVKKLHGLEKERLYTGNRMSHENDTESLSDLINAVDDSRKNELLQMQHSMNAVIQRLNFLQSVTRSILKDKREVFEMTMAAARGEGENMEYTQKGEAKPLDTKQNSSIIFNRSV